MAAHRATGGTLSTGSLSAYNQRINTNQRIVSAADAGTKRTGMPGFFPFPQETIDNHVCKISGVFKCLFDREAGLFAILVPERCATWLARAAGYSTTSLVPNRQ